MNYYPNLLRWFVVTSCLLTTWGVEAQVQHKTQVLLLGTYHMAGTSDALKVEGGDILGSLRQKEINAILDELQAYKPTKIFIESNPYRQHYWDSLYVLTDQGITPKDQMITSESYQFGTRLAQRLHLPKAVVCVNWGPSDTTNQSVNDRFYRVYRKAVNDEYGRINAPDSSYESPMAVSVIDEFKQIYVTIGKQPTKQALLALNEPLLQTKLYYANNLIGIDKDAFRMGIAGSLPNIVRNLHIYENIIHHISDSDERVLVVYGAGHIEALRQMLVGNPRFSLVPLQNVLKK